MARAEPGLASDKQLAHWMEQAASHQTRALAWLRQARDPAERLSPTRRRGLVVLALERLLMARHLLQRARAGPANPELQALLDSHLARLERVMESTEHLLCELEASA